MTAYVTSPSNWATWAELFKAGYWPRVSARFEFRFESLKSILVLIVFVCKLMIGSSKNNRENYPRKCFWTQEKETRVKFKPGLRAIDFRPTGHWRLGLRSLLVARNVSATEGETLLEVTAYAIFIKYFVSLVANCFNWEKSWRLSFK